MQKAVVVISDRPEKFGQLRERLAMVTNAWFAQEYVGLASDQERVCCSDWCIRDFSDVGILRVGSVAALAMQLLTWYRRSRRALRRKL